MTNEEASQIIRAIAPVIEQKIEEAVIAHMTPVTDMMQEWSVGIEEAIGQLALALQTGEGRADAYRAFIVSEARNMGVKPIELRRVQVEADPDGSDGADLAG